MKIDNLIKMANQIAAFFEGMPDRDEALSDLALHIRRFWAPRMRTALLDHVDREQGSGLDELVLQAMERHRAMF